MVLVIGLVVLGGLLLAGLAAGIYWFSTHKPQPVNNPTLADSGGSSDAVTEVKSSTVYIRCRDARGQQSSGTGFFAGRPGHVVTNAHVIGYHPREYSPATKIEVIVRSGEPNERTYVARIYGVEGEADLALLAIDEPDLPRPLKLGVSAALKETDEVLIFGYPFGEQLGRNISVNKSTVSSLRKDKGEIAVVQLSGGLNPGNSGGPVANRSGEVVGVSVAKLRGADGIDFAIPAERAEAFLNDQYASGGTIRPQQVAMGPSFPKNAPPNVGSTRPTLPNIPKVGPPVASPARPREPTAIKPKAVPGDPPDPFTVFVPAERTEIPLNGTVSASVVAGGGRYLIYLLSGKSKLAVFDVQEGKVVKEIGLPEEKVHIAGGARQLLVLLPSAKLIQVWNLATLTRDRVVPYPPELTSDEIGHVAMGYSSAGPLYVQLPKEKRTYCVDVKKFAASEIRWMHWSHSNAYGPGTMRPSPDGTRLYGWGGGWNSCDVAYSDGQTAATSNAKIEFSAWDSSFALPSADSHMTFTTWAVLDRNQTATPLGGLAGAYCLPSIEPGYCLALATFAQWGKIHRDGEAPPTVAVWSEDLRQIGTLKGITDIKWDKAFRELPWDKRVHFYGRSGLLVILGGTRDRIILRKAAVEEQLKADQVDYLYVASRPRDPIPGQPFRYQVEARSNKGGFKYKMIVGPTGMSVDATGLVTWNVPPSFADSARVTVSVTDSSDQEVLHTFVLAAE